MKKEDHGKIGTRGLKGLGTWGLKMEGNYKKETKRTEWLGS